MLVITGCCWPKGISRGGVLAACCEGSRRCRSRTGSEPGQPANRVLRSDPVGTGVTGQAGWRRETDQTSQRNCQTSRDSPLDPGHGDLSLTREGGGHIVLRRCKVEIGNSGSYYSRPQVGAYTLFLDPNEGGYFLEAQLPDTKHESPAI